jgi:hypothetical protein
MPDGSGREELRPLLRDERPPDDAVVVVRGGPTTIEKLVRHARRTHDAFTLDGEPLGFDLLPTFGRPHFTVQLSSGDLAHVADLLQALGPDEPNRYHGSARPRRR